MASKNIHPIEFPCVQCLRIVELREEGTELCRDCATAHTSLKKGFPVNGLCSASMKVTARSSTRPQALALPGGMLCPQNWAMQWKFDRDESFRGALSPLQTKYGPRGLPCAFFVIIYYLIQPIFFLVHFSLFTVFFFICTFLFLFIFNIHFIVGLIYFGEGLEDGNKRNTCQNPQMWSRGGEMQLGL